MISIIISSYNPLLFKQISDNISNTIGVVYELIKVDNPGLMGICEAYNLGAAKAKFDLVVFCHEDILFHTKDWGIILERHLSLENVGIIGSVGGDYVAKAPSGWFSSVDHMKVNIIQHKKNAEVETVNNLNSNLVAVLGVDGLFLGMRRNVYKDLLFDEELKGFHGYDIDVTLRSAKKYQNYVFKDILIEHFSLGDLSKQWLDANIYVRGKVGNKLNLVHDANAEYVVFESFAQRFFQFNKVSIKNIITIMKFYPNFGMNFKYHRYCLRVLFNLLRR